MKNILCGAAALLFAGLAWAQPKDNYPNRPIRVITGSPGAGTSGHLTGELFNLVTKARMTHIPYKGAGFAVTANIAGEVQSSFLSTATAQPHVKSGRL